MVIVKASAKVACLARQPSTRTIQFNGTSTVGESEKHIPFFTYVATGKFFSTGQLARWTGSIVAFVGLREGIKYHINSEKPFVSYY